METTNWITNQVPDQIEAIGVVLSTILRSNSPLGVAYRKHMAERSSNYLTEGGHEHE